METHRIDKSEVIKLARELFKIRVSDAREGPAENDGVHKRKTPGIPFYNDETMQNWYLEAIRTAEIIVGIEVAYLSGGVAQNN